MLQTKSSVAIAGNRLLTRPSQIQLFPSPTSTGTSNDIHINCFCQGIESKDRLEIAFRQPCAANCARILCILLDQRETQTQSEGRGEP